MYENSWLGWPGWWEQSLPVKVSWVGRAVSGFDGHVKLLILNSPNNPEFPDRTVGGRGQCLRNKHCLAWALSLWLCHSVHLYIRTKFIKKKKKSRSALPAPHSLVCRRSPRVAPQPLPEPYQYLSASPGRYRYNRHKRLPTPRNSTRSRHLQYMDGTLGRR